MKIRVVFLILVTVCFMLSMVSSAIGETDIKPVKREMFDYLIDDYIQKCQSKSNLSDSRSKNIRKEAALAALKVEYLNANKDKLIRQMLETELSMKKYKVHYFLNARFFNHYASKSNLQQKVIEANLSKLKIP
ncbi:hypothetical protein ACFL2S_04030 [Thermodesulfobacteriota bacterium]